MLSPPLFVFLAGVPVYDKETKSNKYLSFHPLLNPTTMTANHELHMPKTPQHPPS